MTHRRPSLSPLKLKRRSPASCVVKSVLATALLLVTLYQLLAMDVIRLSRTSEVPASARLWPGPEAAFGAEDRTRMSTLGRILLLGEPRPAARGVNYTVAVWRHGARLERRLLRSYGSGAARPPLRGCAVQNCRLIYTENSEEAAAADAVLFHLQLTSERALPGRRRPQQRWIFLSDESPRHAFLTRNNISHYNGVFNWSMGYRYDTDVPVPYGRTAPGQVGDAATRTHQTGGHHGLELRR
ncbi:Alpha-(1,3)-fucosyltransferase 7 [Amphibalanus amphitrite]|uniref:Alpha-(1,3)-fucosyltransferase 7 n=1 Tax=Amphibalanus amphitrite TaxID=1232801 RepID=A0A6A4WU54_AMPAM|nr:Alpha-(1,3)-fucosyltransferase 7 [Amphibalanus amphitrite]